MMKEMAPKELVRFLEKENRDLKQELKETQELLQLNKSALAIAINSRKDQSEQRFPQVFQILYQENCKLANLNQILREESEKSKCEQLISWQIVSASTEYEKYLTNELKDRLKILKKELDAKEQKILQLTREDGKGAEKWQEYTDMNKISAKLFTEIQYWRQEAELKSQQIVKLKDQKEELIKLNLILTRQVNDLKTYTCQTTKSQTKHEVNTQEDLANFLKYQKRMSDENDGASFEDSDQDGSKSVSPQISSEDASEEEVEEKEQSSKIVPKLQFSLVKKIQAENVKKLNIEAKQKSGTLVKEERWRKLQDECLQLRKRLGDGLIVQHGIEKENLILKRLIWELEQRNAMLVNSKLQAMVEKDYEIERRQYQKQNLETLLDICRDVTFNKTLLKACKGQLVLVKKNIFSKEI